MTVDARVQLHHAFAIASSVGRLGLPAQDDDGHTALSWRDGLLTTDVPTAVGPVRVGLSVGGAALVADTETWSLEGRSLVEAWAWMQEAIARRGLDLQLGTDPRYELPDHPVSRGHAFRFDRGELAELQRAFSQAASLLGAFAARHDSASALRCWPHHFDIGFVLALEPGDAEDSRSLGFGLSAGDDSYETPYYYVNPWPAPEDRPTPDLPSGAHWHTEGWYGAVLTPPPADAEAVQAYLAAGTHHGCAVLGVDAPGFGVSGAA